MHTSLIAVVLACAALRSVYAAVSPGQKQALVDMFNECGGSKWDFWVPYNPPWDLATDPCDGAWSDVECDPHNTTVVSLQLASMGVIGPIPESFGQLTGLQVLDLSYNDIKSLPSSLFAITSLRSLTLRGAHIAAPLPDFNLPNLLKLDAGYSQLTGTLPSSLGVSVGLQYLDLGFNNITGQIPDALVTLSNLSYVCLANNWFTGTFPENIAFMTSLQFLDVRANAIGGTIPDTFGKLINLLGAELDYNQLTGTIPDSLGELVNLKVLDLSANQLTGTLPESIGSMTSLQDFQAHDNQLTGGLPATIGKMDSLMWLLLFNNQFSGTIPPEVFGATNVQSIQLNNNSLSGTLPATVGNLQWLTNLDVSVNQLSGTLPDLNPALLIFNASFNYFEGGIPQFVTYPTPMDDDGGYGDNGLQLYLSNNCLTAPVNINVTDMLYQCLITLDVSFNEINGDAYFNQICSSTGESVTARDVSQHPPYHSCSCRNSNQRPLPGFACAGCSCCPANAAGQPCSGHGTCGPYIHGQQSSQCECQVGYSGADCSIKS